MKRSEAEMDQLRQEVSSGSKNIGPADDPSTYGLLMRYKDTNFLNDVYIRNSKNSKSKLEFYDHKLASLTDSVRDVRNLVLEAGNSPTFQDFPESYRKRIDNLITSIVATSNSKFNGEYIFSGSKTMTRPFEAVYNGDTIASVNYNGDSNPVVINPDPSGNIKIDLSGRAIFLGKAGMGEDLFQEIINIRNDMNGNKFENLDVHLDKIDAIFDRLVDKRGEVGSNGKHLEMVIEYLENIEITIQGKLVEIEGVDLSEAITMLLSQENIYKAGLEVASRMDRLSFVDYMR